MRTEPPIPPSPTPRPELLRRVLDAGYARRWRRRSRQLAVSILVVFALGVFTAFHPASNRQEKVVTGPAPVSLRPTPTTESGPTPNATTSASATDPGVTGPATTIGALPSTTITRPVPRVAPPLVYMREDQQGNIRIMVLRSGATAAVPLTDGKGHERDPVISADGSHVAFASDRNNALAGLHTVNEIFLIGIDGQGLQQVTNSPIGQGNGSDYPAFSPDGTRIAYAQDDANDHGEIWVTDLRTGTARQVSNQPSSPGGAFAPTWSPDGSRLAYERGPAPYAIWVVGATGSGERQLPITPLDTNNSRVHWLPDGTHLLTGQRNADGTRTAVQLDVDTGAAQPVPLNDDPFTPAPCGNGQFIYVTDPDGPVFLGGGPQPSQLMLAGLDGSNPTSLLTDLTGFGATGPSCASAAQLSD